ncbi:MAG: hypothetical protein ACRDRA_14245 [Pseudonocardiaceae bacterium]
MTCDGCGSLAAGSVVFDRYRLVERIGVGGTGEVWRSADLLLDQPVALKRICLAGGGYQAELNRKRALREARIEPDPAARPDAATARDMLDQFSWGDLGRLRHRTGCLPEVNAAGRSAREGSRGGTEKIQL